MDDLLFLIQKSSVGFLFKNSTTTVLLAIQFLKFDIHVTSIILDFNISVRITASIPHYNFFIFFKFFINIVSAKSNGILATFSLRYKYVIYSKFKYFKYTVLHFSNINIWIIKPYLRFLKIVLYAEIKISLLYTRINNLTS